MMASTVANNVSTWRAPLAVELSRYRGSVWCNRPRPERIHLLTNHRHVMTTQQPSRSRTVLRCLFDQATGKPWPCASNVLLSPCCSPPDPRCSPRPPTQRRAAVDKSRLTRQMGQLGTTDLRAVEDGVRIVLGSEGRSTWKRGGG